MHYPAVAYWNCSLSICMHKVTWKEMNRFLSPFTMGKRFTQICWPIPMVKNEEHITWQYACSSVSMPIVLSLIFIAAKMFWNEIVEKNERHFATHFFHECSIGVNVSHLQESLCVHFITSAAKNQQWSSEHRQKLLNFVIFILIKKAPYHLHFWIYKH
jgi:hypothetical protein